MGRDHVSLEIDFLEGTGNDLLDYVIVLDEDHLLRLLREYVTYYHIDRTHLGLGEDTPLQRDIEPPDKRAIILVLPRLGGLHQRYTRKSA